MDFSHGLLALSALGLCFFGLGAWSAVRHVRGRRVPRSVAELPPISLLKPLKGNEERLADNLRSFFTQDYPELEIIFSTTSFDDPALAVARAVAAEHPRVPVRFVLSNEVWGLNPKVANLEGALRVARHDLVLQTDANVRIRPGYLQAVVSEFLTERADLLSSLVVGVGERSPGAAMENLQLTALIVPSVCFALRFFGVPCVIGKSMLFRRSTLERLGGLALVKDTLAEDYLLGRAFQRAGLRVILSAETVENVNVETTVDRFFSRHARWLKMRAVIHPPAFVADPFANPVALAALASVASGLDPGIVFGAVILTAVKMCLDAFVLARVRGEPMRARLLAVAPLKDLLLFAMWPYAAVSRSVEWRGARYRMGWQSRLRPDAGPWSLRTVRRAIAGARRVGLR